MGPAPCEFSYSTKLDSKILSDTLAIQAEGFDRTIEFGVFEFRKQQTNVTPSGHWANVKTESIGRTFQQIDRTTPQYWADFEFDRLGFGGQQHR